MALGRGRRGRHARHNKLDATPPWQDPPKPAGPVTAGPWDAGEAPDDGLERIDLGALQVPAVAGVDVRVEVGADGQVVSATLSHSGSELQVGVFAAPRTAGIWGEVRREILASLAAQGGTGQEVRGEFGRELTGRVPVRGGYQATRFVGVDGPRWFLRGLYIGPAATDPARAAPLTDVLRRIVVVRGSEPMPVRDPLPLRLPKGLAEQATPPGGIAAPDGTRR
ncbi:MAG: DUF3710 domain-containing protein [Actinobacteria bacterium]|nr:DUF3710 domain-containing protein [Actinomycetota bacterium]